MAPPNPNSNPRYANPTTVKGVHRLGKDFMNRGSKKLGKLGPQTPEEKRFRAYYGLSAVTVLNSLTRARATGEKLF